MVAAAVVGGAVIGGVATTSAARSASKGQQAAARQATQAEREMFDITREDQAPYRALATEVGLPGIRNVLAQERPITLQDVLTDPGYQFGMDEGRRLLEGSAAARGGLYSGATLRAINRYGNDYATTKFNDVFNRRENALNNRFNRFARAANIGQVATNQVAAQGSQLGQSIAGNLIGGGNASAAAAIAQGNTFGNVLNRASSYGATWLNSPAQQGSAITNGNLLRANMSDDPIGSLGSQQGWF